MANFSKGEWEAGYNPGVTGPTMPAVCSPVCGGEDWPYRTVNIGTETIAIVPAQSDNRIPGQKGKPIEGNAEANANLIVAAVNACQKVNPNNPQAVAEAIGDMYEALKEIKQLCREAAFKQDKERQIISTKCFLALAKAKGKIQEEVY